MTTFLTLSLLILVLAVLLFLLIRTLKDTPDRTELARLQTRDLDYQATAKRLQERDTQIDMLLAEKARLTSDLAHEQRQATEKIALLQEAEDRLKHAFENLANRIFEDKGKVITEQNRERLSGLLQPLREQLESFRKRVDEVHRDDTAQSARLIEQVRQLQTLSNKVSDEANHLAKAITGEAKRQGDWGELIVERLFEASGLTRGREYDIQVSLRDENSALQRPDFIVYLPGGKSVIVDAKVSLTAYTRFCQTENEADKQLALSEHIHSVRNHIQELRGKNYPGLLGNRTLDFVLMCIPLEPAYQTAFQADDRLLYDLAQSNVVVTGPATLMITLKLIAQIWRREHENRNAEVIADRAGRLYDQVKLVVDAMAAVKKNLGDAQQSFDLALARLQSNRGNLVGRVEELRKLGAKINKPIPPTVVEQAQTSEWGTTDPLEPEEILSDEAPPS